MDLRDLFDLAGVIRYGVPTAEKERIAISAELPGNLGGSDSGGLRFALDS